MLKLLSIGLLFISYALSAQIDSVLVTAQLKERGGYSKLADRFNKSDSTLTIEDFKLIYYGYQTTPSYYSKDVEFKENLIKPLNRSGQYNQVLEVADSILLINPVSIAAHFEKAFACARLGKTDLEAYHRKRYILLCNVIKTSGDGSALLRFNCNSTNDALEFISYKGFTAINDRKTDTGLVEFDLAKNKLKLLHMYFFIPNEAYTAPNLNPDSE
ncbi:MAG: DUF4919 domain-containing protein [Cytophaga sp.]|uniref:DUF4919 domain-containing protein n=1 Tax=Cytophaga sp. TaxID=29535 RepID=UPI003F7F8A7C